MSTTENLQSRANALRLYGLLTHWPELANADWVEPLVRVPGSIELAVRFGGNLKTLNNAFREFTIGADCERLNAKQRSADERQLHFPSDDNYISPMTT